MSKIDIDPTYIDRMIKLFMIETGKPQKINGDAISNYTGTIDKTMATPRWFILLKELTVLGWG